MLCQEFISDMNFTEIMTLHFRIAPTSIARAMNEATGGALSPLSASARRPRRISGGGRPLAAAGGGASEGHEDGGGASGRGMMTGERRRRRGRSAD